MRDTDRETLEGMIGRAAVGHGHTCPSLVYGVRLALIVSSRIPAGIRPRSVTVRHSSTCLLDGAVSALGEFFPGLRPVAIRGSGGCGLEVEWAGGRVAASVPPAVRQRVDAIKRDHPDLEEFRAAGVAFLLSLEDGGFAVSEP